MAGDGATLVWTKTITTAITGETQLVMDGMSGYDHILLYSVFDYGSGGTTAKAWLQTSLDNGATWFDVVSHAFTTADGSKVSALSRYIAPASQGFAPGDAALADNTIVQGVFGDMYRVKVTTTGTYGGSTTLNVYLTAGRRR